MPTPEPSTIIKTKPYPNRNSKDAPVFTSHSTPLHWFLEDIEELCKDRGDETDLTRTRKTLWYVNYKFHSAWKSILDESKSWTSNKQTLLESFPGLDLLYKYSINNIAQLLLKFSSKNMDTQETLAEYHCKFMVLANYLEKVNLVSWDELNRKYVLGLPSGFRNKVLSQLTVEDLKRQLGLVHDYLQVNQAAHYVLQDNFYVGCGIDEKPTVLVHLKCWGLGST